MKTKIDAKKTVKILKTDKETALINIDGLELGEYCPLDVMDFLTSLGVDKDYVIEFTYRAVYGKQNVVISM